MTAECEKRKKRKGISDERINELNQKIEALKIEKEKQILEIKEKYSLKALITFENSIIYHIPLIELFCEVSHHHEIYKQVFYYESIFKRIY